MIMCQPSPSGVTQHQRVAPGLARAGAPSRVLYQRGSGLTTGASPTRRQVIRSSETATPIRWSLTPTAAGVDRGVEHPPRAVVVADHRAGPQGQVVPTGVAAGPRAVGRIVHSTRSVERRVADRRRQVSPIGVDQGSRRLQVEQVIGLAVVDDPAVPDPVPGVAQHERKLSRLPGRAQRSRGELGVDRRAVAPRRSSGCPRRPGPALDLHPGPETMRTYDGVNAR